MSQYGKDIRLKRILRPGRGSLVVAFDHPLVLGPIPGTAQPALQISRFIEGQADALLLNLGSFCHVAETAASGACLPGLIARLDWTTALGTAQHNPMAGFRSCLVANPEDAMRAGADAVIVFLVLGSGDIEFERNEIERVARVARECDRVGMPLIIESVARGKNAQNPQSPEWLMLHTRTAAELGADLIKTEFTGEVQSMREVVKACPVPILVLGGSRTGSDEDILKITRNIMQAGAAGVFFGRNVFQAENVPELLSRLHGILATGPAKS